MRKVEAIITGCLCDECPEPRQPAVIAVVGAPIGHNISVYLCRSCLGRAVCLAETGPAVVMTTPIKTLAEQLQGCKTLMEQHSLQRGSLDTVYRGLAKALGELERRTGLDAAELRDKREPLAGLNCPIPASIANAGHLTVTADSLLKTQIAQEALKRRVAHAHAEPWWLSPYAFHDQSQWAIDGQTQKQDDKLLLTLLRNCRTQPLSSRICEYGTKGCEVRHQHESTRTTCPLSPSP